MNVADALLAARDLLRQRGWAAYPKNPESALDSRICMGDAVMTICTHHYTTKPCGRVDMTPFEVLNNYCLSAYGGNVAWSNDHRVESEDEACEILEQVAKDAMNEGGDE